MVEGIFVERMHFKGMPPFVHVDNKLFCVCLTPSLFILTEKNVILKLKISIPILINIEVTRLCQGLR